MSTSVPNSFEKLLEAFLDSLGHDLSGAKGSSGFEFGSGDFTVRVFPDSTNPEILVIEVDVRQLDVSETLNAPLLLMLHRLNEAARSAHPWSATIDENSLLLLSAMRPISEVDAVVLQMLVSDALDRAESLAALVEQFSSAPSSQSTEVLPAFPFIDRA
jgi:hypothetical protein